MWDQALKQDAGAVIIRAAREGRRMPFGAILQASKTNAYVAHYLVRWEYKLNSQQKLAVISSNKDAPRQFLMSSQWNDQMARAAIQAHPNMLELIDRSRGVPGDELVELATQLHPQDAVWAAQHLKDLSPQTEKNIIAHMGPETWEIFRRWTKKTN
jgi:hypothetical protein